MGLNDFPACEDELIPPQLFVEADEVDDTGTNESIGPVNIGDPELNQGNLQNLVESLATNEISAQSTSSIEGAAAHQAIMDNLFGQPGLDANEDLHAMLGHVMEDAHDPTIARAIQLLNINRKIWKIYQLVFVQMLISMEEDFHRLIKREENMLKILRSLGSIELEKMSEANRDESDIALAGEKLTRYLHSVFDNLQENGLRNAVPLIQNLKTAVSLPLILPPLAPPTEAQPAPQPLDPGSD